jgi:hypothetical protein
VTWPAERVRSCRNDLVDARGRAPAGATNSDVVCAPIAGDRATVVPPFPPPLGGGRASYEPVVRTLVQLGRWTSAAQMTEVSQLVQQAARPALVHGTARAGTAALCNRLSALHTV